jgi:hypothetical protein
MANLLSVWSLVAIDVVVYGSLLAGVLVARRVPLKKTLTLGAAFGALEGVLAQSFPELPSGFTWKEGLAQARKLRLDVNWGRVDDELQRYEAFRYGGSEQPGAGGYEVARLTTLLRRGRLGF